LSLIVAPRDTSHNGSVLRVLVAALALEAFDFTASSSYRAPLVALAAGVLFVDFPEHFCLIDGDGFATFD
jgi:hypothetical protein